MLVFQMAFRMRSSKFRHVYGSPFKKEQCYECVSITKNAHDSNFCSVNPKFIAIVTESIGGGAFVVIPLEKVRRTSRDSRCAVPSVLTWNYLCRISVFSLREEKLMLWKELKLRHMYVTAVGNVVGRKTMISQLL